METGKESLLKIIHSQPDNASREEILTELVFAQMIEEGLNDSRNGRIISHEDMRIHIESLWK